MEQYYTNDTGALLRRDGGYVSCFDLKRKDWWVVEWNAEKWAAENLDPESPKAKAITREQAMERMQRQLLTTPDREQLKQCIDLLCQNRKIQWHPMEEREDGVLILGYPEYPEDLYEAFCLLGSSRDYRTEMENWPKNLLPTDMNVLQIRTALTYIQRAERFCEGIIAESVDNGTLLKLMLRLEDLMNAAKGKARLW